MKRALFMMMTLSAAAAGLLRAQDRCGSGDAPRGDLGVIINADATVSARPTAGRPWRFRSPIEVARVLPGGPAEGILEVGDLITAIDGMRVTEAAGASRLASIAPATRTSLSVTRGSDRLTRMLVTGSVCPGDARAIGSYAPGAITARDTARRQGAGVPVPSLPDLESSGWLGLALACSGCGWAREAGDDAPYWESTEPPVIHALAPRGPAARAGLRVGDTLTHVGEYPVTSKAGGRMLGAVQPGTPVLLTIRRAGIARRFTVVPQGRPKAPSVAASYRSRVAGAEIEVSANGTPGVTVEERGGAVLVRVGEAVIRVAPARCWDYAGGGRNLNRNSERGVRTAEWRTPECRATVRVSGVFDVTADSAAIRRGARGSEMVVVQRTADGMTEFRATGTGSSVDRTLTVNGSAAAPADADVWLATHLRALLRRIDLPLDRAE